MTLPSANNLEGSTGRTTVANTWVLSREDETWVGPVAVNTHNLNGDPITDVLVEGAVIARRSRPSDDDWAPLVGNPDNPAQRGVMVSRVNDAGEYGLWIRGSRGDVVVVLPPDRVGYLVRT